jgi:FKBP-type peptidyl-prolyl cis-trans isomerase
LVLVQAGCEEPEQIVPTTPPGAVIPREPPDKDDPAQAQGESIAIAPKSTGESGSKPTAYVPSPPTPLGVSKTTKGGVRYETLKEGNGTELRPGQAAEFYYTGKLQDGSVFDSRTKANGGPAQFTIGGPRGLIKGWEEGLPGMREGETRKLIIPPSMGYGDQQQPGIPPKSTLIFEVELVRILN